MTWWIVGAAAWVACGIAEAGFNYAYFQRTFPEIASRMRTTDAKLSIILAVFGPLALVSTFIFGSYKHGWLFPGSRP